MENDNYLLRDVDFGNLSFGLGTILLFSEFFGKCISFNVKCDFQSNFKIK
jgi:hypothetical protein